MSRRVIRKPGEILKNGRDQPHANAERAALAASPSAAAASFRADRRVSTRCDHENQWKPPIPHVSEGQEPTKNENLSDRTRSSRRVFSPFLSGEGHGGQNARPFRSPVRAFRLSAQVPRTNGEGHGPSFRVKGRGPESARALTACATENDKIWRVE